MNTTDSKRMQGPNNLVSLAKSLENISGVVQHLKKELERAKNEVERYGAESGAKVPRVFWQQ